jgi:hypothetical protein
MSEQRTNIERQLQEFASFLEQRARQAESDRKEPVPPLDVDHYDGFLGHPSDRGAPNRFGRSLLGAVAAAVVAAAAIGGVVATTGADSVPPSAMVCSGLPLQDAVLDELVADGLRDAMHTDPAEVSVTSTGGVVLTEVVVPLDRGAVLVSRQSPVEPRETAERLGDAEMIADDGQWVTYLGTEGAGAVAVHLLGPSSLLYVRVETSAEGSTPSLAEVMAMARSIAGSVDDCG